MGLFLYKATSIRIVLNVIVSQWYIGSKYVANDAMDSYPPWRLCVIVRQWFWNFIIFCVRNSLQTAHIPWCSEFFISPASLPFLSIHFKSRSIQEYGALCANFQLKMYYFKVGITRWERTVRKLTLTSDELAWSTSCGSTMVQAVCNFCFKVTCNEEKLKHTLLPPQPLYTTLKISVIGAVCSFYLQTSCISTLC